MISSLSPFLLLVYTISALGNTEIVNFSATEEKSVDLAFVNNWPVLRPEVSLIQRNLTALPLGTIISKDSPPCADLEQWDPRLDPPTPCSNELWVVLDTGHDDWKSFSKFTLRLSWAAFHPVDVYMKIFDPAAISPLPTQGSAHQHLHKTRRKYARIQLVFTGVLTPRATPPPPEAITRVIPIFLKLEPLYFGFIPESVIPVILFMIPVVIIGSFAASKVNKYLQGVAEEARKEVAAMKAQKAD